MTTRTREQNWRRLVRYVQREYERELEEPIEYVCAERYAEAIAFEHHERIAAEGACHGCAYCAHGLA